MENTVKKFSKGEVIFEKSQVQFGFYEILSGSVNIYSDFGEPSEKLLVEMVPGQTFGEMGLLGYRPRSATAVAAQDLEVRYVDEEGFEAYLNEDPERILRMMKQLSDRTRSLTYDYNEALHTVAEIKKNKKSEKLKGMIRKFSEIWSIINYV